MVDDVMSLSIIGVGLNLEGRSGCGRFGGFGCGFEVDVIEVEEVEGGAVSISRLGFWVEWGDGK